MIGVTMGAWALPTGQLAVWATASGKTYRGYRTAWRSGAMPRRRGAADAPAGNCLATPPTPTISSPHNFIPRPSHESTYALIVLAAQCYVFIHLPHPFLSILKRLLPPHPFLQLSVPQTFPSYLPLPAHPSDSIISRIPSLRSPSLHHTYPP